MRRSLLVAQLVVVITLAVTGCGSESDSTTAGSSADGATPAVAPTLDAPDTVEPTAAPEPTDTPEATAPAEGQGPRDLVDLAGIEQLAVDAIDPGPKPELSWDAIGAAETYYLVLWDSAGRPYWAWWGEQTSVVLGGGTGDRTGQTPSRQPEMTMRVFAFAADDSLVGATERVPLD